MSDAMFHLPTWHPELRPSAGGPGCARRSLRPASRLSPECNAAFPPVKLSQTDLAYNLPLGYDLSVTNISKAASLLGRKSAEARAKKWGKKEFVRRMQEWGRLGGRPRTKSVRRKES
jgi:hypothetical protein